MDLDTQARLIALEHAIGILIMTHPEPGKFADIYRQTLDTSYKDNPFHPHPPELRQRVLALADTLIHTLQEHAAPRP